MISECQPTNDMNLSIIKFYGPNFWSLFCLWSNNIAGNSSKESWDTNRSVKIGRYFIVISSCGYEMWLLLLKKKIDTFKTTKRCI